jgi:hypothetical protein
MPMVVTADKQRPKIKGKADVVFVIDVTGSMTGCLENLKANLVELSKGVEEIARKEYKVAAPEIRYNVIGFRDLEKDVDDPALVIRDKGFTADLAEIEAFFAKSEMQAAGGDDDPESALDALYTALTALAWEKPARVLVLFTDAFTKPTLHPKTVKGQTFDEKRSLDVVIQEIKGTRIIIFGPEGVPAFKVISARDNCTYVEMKKAEDTLKDFKNSGLFKDNVIRLIAKTVADASTKPWKPPIKATGA